MALPRLTGALRSFSNVTKQDNYNEEVADLKMKRSKLHEQIVGLDLTWKKIVKFLNEKLETSEMQSVNEDLKDILQAAKQIGVDLHTAHQAVLWQVSHIQNRGRWAQMLALRQSSSSKKRKIGNRC
uniref:Activating signal cointegrator 1 complex subunit 3 n=1 Tax=Equus asinus TaxID=9793 RepID=A0A9L0J2U8_EQUAS